MSILNKGLKKKDIGIVNLDYRWIEHTKELEEYDFVFYLMTDV